MFNISQVSAGPDHETADTLQMAPYNVRAMARFVNIHKQGLREQAQQNEKMHLELVKYIDTSKTQGCNDLREAKLELVKYMDTSKTQGFNDLQEVKLELVKHIDTLKTQGYNDLQEAKLELGISKEKERLLLEQLNSVSAERNVLSTRNAEITASLEVERELKRSKTEAFDRQGVELERVKTEMECVKQENYDLSKTKSELTGSLELKTEAFDQQGVELERVKKENYDMSNTNHAQTKELDRMRDDVRSTLQYNNDYADEVSRKNEVISQLQHQVSELNRDNKQLENEKASLYQLQQKCNSNDPPPRRFF